MATLSLPCWGYGIRFLVASSAQFQTAVDDDFPG